MTFACAQSGPVVRSAARAARRGDRAFAVDAPPPAPDSNDVDDDRADIAASLDGDGAAYERIVRRYQDRIAGRMWRFARDERELAELVQEVFVSAYFSLAGYRGEAPLLHWLGKIAVRVGYRHWKDQSRRRVELPLADYDAPVETDRGAEAAAEIVEQLLAKLPPRDRLVITLMYLEGRTVAEAAELAGWSQTMTRVQAWRAKKKLRKLLAEAGLPAPRPEEKSS